MVLLLFSASFFIGCQADQPSTCNDGFACTQDYNIDGKCIFIPVYCFDNNTCTSDSCDPCTGKCVFTPIPCPVPYDPTQCTTVEGNMCTGCNTVYDTSKPQCVFLQALSNLEAEMAQYGSLTPSPRCTTEFVFNNEILSELANTGREVLAQQSKNSSDAILAIVERIYSYYPPTSQNPIVLNVRFDSSGNPDLNNNWLISDTIAAPLNLYIIYSSFIESLQIWSAPLGIGTAFGGRYDEVSFRDYALRGSYSGLTLGQDNISFTSYPPKHQPGFMDPMITPNGTAGFYQVDRNTVVLEYARGNMPSTYQIGFVYPTEFFNYDWEGALQYITISRDLVGGNCFPSLI